MKGEFAPVQARYVQVIIDVVHHIYIDELEIYGCTDVTGVPLPVVKRIICTPAENRLVIATMSFPGAASKESPFLRTVSP